MGKDGGRVWKLIQDWLDAQAIKDISDAQLGRLIGFSQSNFPTWRHPKSLPPRETLGAISKAIRVDYEVVRDAFLKDLRYDVPPTDDELAAAELARKERAAGKSIKMTEGKTLAPRGSKAKP